MLMIGARIAGRKSGEGTVVRPSFVGLPHFPSGFAA